MAHRLSKTVVIHALSHHYIQPQARTPSSPIARGSRLGRTDRRSRWAGVTWDIKLGAAAGIAAPPLNPLLALLGGLIQLAIQKRPSSSQHCANASQQEQVRQRPKRPP